MRLIKIIFKTLLISGIVLLLSGCVSLVEKTGQVLDGSASAEKKLAHYRGEGIEIRLMESKAGEGSIIIELDNFPMMKLRGSAPDENGNIVLTSLEYLSGNANGWNEFTLDILGEGELSLNENIVFKIHNDIESVQISAGKIHRFDTRIIGNDALTSLRNRNERIITCVEWMASLDSAPKGLSIKEFEQYWKPLLFPELVSSKNKPSGWLQEGDQFSRAEDINWNISYTQRIFPEELWAVRNSGTMLRDWEEALPWIYLEFEWDSIKELLVSRIILRETSRGRLRAIGLVQ